MLDDGWTLSSEFFNAMTLNLPPDQYPKLLEFGSGLGTEELVKAGYDVTSIEHDKKWLNKVDGTNYVHAPLKDQWYNIKIVKPYLQQSFDIWLIDGPPGGKSLRTKLFSFLDESTPMPRAWCVDDLHRNKNGLDFYQKLLRRFGKPLKNIHITAEFKKKQSAIVIYR